MSKFIGMSNQDIRGSRTINITMLLVKRSVDQFGVVDWTEGEAVKRAASLLKIPLGSDKTLWQQDLRHADENMKRAAAILQRYHDKTEARYVWD